MTQPDPEHLTVQDVATRLNIGVGKVHTLVKGGHLPAINIGAGSKAYWRISRDDFEQYLTDQRAKTAAAIRERAAS